MVEGGQQVLTAFLREQQAHRVIVTISPMFVGGTSAVEELTPDDAHDFPRLTNLQQRWYGEDLVLEGDPVWPTD